MNDAPVEATPATPATPMYAGLPWSKVYGAAAGLWFMVYGLPCCSSMVYDAGEGLWFMVYHVV